MTAATGSAYRDLVDSLCTLQEMVRWRSIAALLMCKASGNLYWLE